ncbi:MAG: hypothetical protein JOZ47_10775 [Kutzneria sp.]|nr:hypothetical protein [Kutzneria sp.]
MTTLTMLAIAVLAIPALSTPDAAADPVTVQCAVEGTPSGDYVLTCTNPVGQGILTCESPSPITVTDGVFTVAPARCTGTASTLLGNGTGQLTATTLSVNTATGQVTILGGTATLTLTQPQTGSSLGIACIGSVLNVTALTLNIPQGTCTGTLTVTTPVGTTQTSMTCAGSITLNTTQLTLQAPNGGGCTGTLTVTVPGMVSALITADNPTIVVTAKPAPVVTVTSPHLTVQVFLAGIPLAAVACSTVTIDFNHTAQLLLQSLLSPCTTA